MNIGIKVNLLVDYSIVCETLERIGVIDRKKMKVYPSCYCHKFDDGYRICHFKEMFALVNKPSNPNSVDILRLKTIVYFLQRWNLINPIEPIDAILKEKIDTIKYEDKKKYKIVHKFQFKG